MSALKAVVSPGPTPAPFTPVSSTPYSSSKTTHYTSSNSTYSPVVRSSSIKPSPVSPRPEPTTPRTAGQRFLPETPKTTPTAVPPAYANVHSQLNSGNARQIAPQIAKLLEEPKSEKGREHYSRDPPAVPKPAARMSLRSKVKRMVIIVKPLLLVIMVFTFVCLIVHFMCWKIYKTPLILFFLILGKLLNTEWWSELFVVGKRIYIIISIFLLDFFIFSFWLIMYKITKEEF